MGNDVSGEAKGGDGQEVSFDGSTHEEFGFSTPNGTPTSSVRPSPSASVQPSPSASQVAPLGNQLSGNDILLAKNKQNGMDTSFTSIISDADTEGDLLSPSSPPTKAQRNVAIAEDSNDTLDKPPQFPLHTTIDHDSGDHSSPLHTIVPSIPEEDHAWMDPILAAAAAGAASKKSRQDLERSDLERTIKSFGLDDDWRESFHRLASTARETASTLTHMAAPVLNEAADTVKKSAKEIGESYRTANDEKRQETSEGSRGGTVAEDVKEAFKHGSDQSGDNDWRESFRRLASTTQSAAATFAHLAAPVLSEAADVVKKSAIEVGESSSKTGMKDKTDVHHNTGSANFGWEATLEQLASTTQSAAGNLLLCCDDTLKITTSDAGEVELSLNRANDGTQPTLMNLENEAVAKDTVMDGTNRPVTARNALLQHRTTRAADDDWKVSLERLAWITKSATAESAHVAAPMLVEAAEVVIKSVAPDERLVDESKLGKYGGVGYRPIAEENMEVKPIDNWQKSLQRLASSSKSTASTFVTFASPILTESANIVIETAKEAVEDYKVSRRERSEFQVSNRPMETSENVLPKAAMEEPDQTADISNGGKHGDVADLSHSKDGDAVGSDLDISNDKTVRLSHRWHDEKTPIRKHGLAPRDDGTSALSRSLDPTRTTDADSPDSSISPRFLDTTTSIASRTSPSTLEKMVKCDQDDNGSVTSLSVTSSRSVVSSHRMLHREKDKNLLSPPKKFMEMVSKKLASDSLGYPPTHRSSRKASLRTSRGAGRNVSITPSSVISPNGFSFSLEQSSFLEERQPVSPSDSLQQSGSIIASTPPNQQPPEEVTLWDMFPSNESDAIAQGGRGSVLVEPQPRILLENAPGQFLEGIRSGSTYSSEDHQSLPMLPGSIGKRKIPNAYINDTASDPGTTPLKRRRKYRRPKNVIIPPLPLSPKSFNMDVRPMHNELSPERQHDAELFYFDSLEAAEDTKIAELPGRQDKMLDEALLAFSSLNDIDFLSEISPQRISESLHSLASVRWRQLTANWEHDEMMKAISSRPCSLHCFKKSNQDDEHVNDWSGKSWTTSVYNSKRERFSLHNDFLSSQRTLPSMANLSGFSPLLCEGELRLTPFVTGIGAAPDGDNAHQTVLRHTLSCRKESSLQDLLQSAKTKLNFYAGLIKEIATFATMNSDPANPKTAVHHSVDVKATAAVVQKADRKYDGDIFQVKDILRGQIILPDESSLVCALASLNAICGSEDPSIGERCASSCTPEIKIVRVKNLFLSRPAKTPLSENLPTGYRHILVTLRFNDGFLAELQLQLSQMFQILGEQGYKLHRQITQMDMACTYTEAPDFEQFTHDTSLQNILRRMFRIKELNSNSATTSTSVPAQIQSSSGTSGQLPTDGVSEGSTVQSAVKGEDDRTVPGADMSNEAIERSQFPGGGGIAAAATLAARSRHETSEAESSKGRDEVKGRPPFPGGSGIAAAAALAARNRNKVSEGESSNGRDDSSEPVTDAIDEASEHPSFLGGGGIAAAAALAARNRNKVFEGESASGGDDSTVADASDKVSERPPFLGGGGIAAAAALAALYRNDASEGDSSNGPVPVADTSDEASARPPFPGGGGIATAAALAARNRNTLSEGEPSNGGDDSAVADTSYELSGRSPFPEGGGIAAAAALAARNRIKASGGESSNVGDDGTVPVADTSDEGSACLPFLGGGGIAAAAALAARNRHKLSVEESVKGGDEAIGRTPFPGGSGIAAAAALAARNRNKDSEGESSKGGDDCTEPVADVNEETSGRPPFPGSGGIAAAAALAARNRNKLSEGRFSTGGDDSTEAVDVASNKVNRRPPFPGGEGIAAAAALAARTRNKASEGESSNGEDDSTEHVADTRDEASARPPFLGGGGNAAAAALAARNRYQVLEGDSSTGRDDSEKPVADASDEASEHPPFLGGGGIAAAAALAARNRNKLSEGGFSTGKDDSTEPVADASVEVNRRSPFPGGGGIAAAAALATRARHKASDGQSLNDGDGNLEATAVAVDEALLSGGGGIASAMALAAQNRIKDSVPESLKDGDTGAEPDSQSSDQCLLCPEIPQHSVQVILKLLIFEALENASCNSRRISTLCCVSSLCYGVAFGIRNSLEPFAFDKEKYNTGGLSPLEPDALLRIGDRALLRALTIANQVVSNGMIGWLEYGSSNLRTATRPLEILGKIAYHHAMRKDWHASINVLRTLVSRCEYHLSLYHPLTLSSMLDLAAAFTMVSEHTMARLMLRQATERLAFYLAEQEGAYAEFRDKLHSGNRKNVTLQDLTGADFVSMLRAFTSLFEELMDRDYLQLFGSDNDVVLVNHCLLGDSLSVLANCLRLSETSMGVRPASSKSDAYWSAACQHYRLALEGWTRKGCGLTHPNVSAVACAIARCLRELGRRDRSIQILTAVVGATSRASSSGSEVSQKLDEGSQHPNDDSLPLMSFLPLRAGSFSSPLRAKANVAIEQSTALNLWYMAAYEVESSQDERGRIRALSLLHASSEALQRALQESKDGGDTRNATYLEMLQCVEAEALELFKPLEAIREEKPRERKVDVAAIKSSSVQKESYKPTRVSLPTSQKTSTKADTFKLSTDDKTPHNDGSYPKRRFRPRPKKSSVHWALA